MGEARRVTEPTGTRETGMDGQGCALCDDRCLCAFVFVFVTANLNLPLV